MANFYRIVQFTQVLLLVLSVAFPSFNADLAPTDEVQQTADGEFSFETMDETQSEGVAEETQFENVTDQSEGVTDVNVKTATEANRDELINSDPVEEIDSNRNLYDRDESNSHLGEIQSDSVIIRSDETLQNESSPVASSESGDHFGSEDDYSIGADGNGSSVQDENESAVGNVNSLECDSFKIDATKPIEMLSEQSTDVKRTRADDGSYVDEEQIKLPNSDRYGTEELDEDDVQPEYFSTDDYYNSPRPSYEAENLSEWDNSMSDNEYEAGLWDSSFYGYSTDDDLNPTLTDYPVRKSSASYKEIHRPFGKAAVKYKTKISLYNPTIGNEYENGMFTEKMQTGLPDDDDYEINENDSNPIQTGYPVRKSATYKEVHRDRVTDAPVKTKIKLAWDDRTGEGRYENPTITRKRKTAVNIPRNADVSNLLGDLIAYGLRYNPTSYGSRRSRFRYTY